MKIEKSQYEGYLWYSNQPQPKVLNNEVFELELSDDANPFIVEGLLFDGKISISIKYVDGHYITNHYKIQELENVKKEEQMYYSHRMKGRQLKFYQFWRPIVDELCEKMEVLQPAELVFIGFHKKEE